METKNIKIGQHKLFNFLLSLNSDKLEKIIPLMPDKVAAPLTTLQTIGGFSPKSEVERCIHLLPDDIIEFSIPLEIEKELFNGEDDVENKKPKLVKMIEDYFNDDENRPYIEFILDDDDLGEEVVKYYLHRQDDIAAKLHWFLLKAHQTGRNNKYLYYNVFDDSRKDILFKCMSVREMLWSLEFE